MSKYMDKVYAKFLQNYADAGRTNVENALNSVLTYYAETDPASRTLLDRKERLSYVSPGSHEKTTSLIQQLERYGIPCKSFEYEGKEMVIFAKSDASLVQKMINREQAEHLRGGDCERSALVEVTGRMMTVKPLNALQCDYLTTVLKEKDVPFNTFYQTAGKNYELYYSDRDIKEVKDAIKQLSVELTGRSGEHLQNLYEFNEQKFADIQLRIVQPDYRTLTATNRYFMTVGKDEQETEKLRAALDAENRKLNVIDRNGDTIRVTRGTLSYHHSDEKEEYIVGDNTTKEDKIDKATRALFRMDRPVEVTEKEMEHLLTLSMEERSRELEKMEIERGFPVIDRETAVEIAHKEQSFGPMEYTRANLITAEKELVQEATLENGTLNGLLSSEEAELLSESVYSMNADMNELSAYYDSYAHEVKLSDLLHSQTDPDRDLTNELIQASRETAYFEEQEEDISHYGG